MKKFLGGSLAVVVATVVASATILMSRDGVAEAIKKEALVELSSKSSLPPPGPFNITESDAKLSVNNVEKTLENNHSTGGLIAPKTPLLGVQGSVKMPLVPKMPLMALEPTFKRAMPSFSKEDAPHSPVKMAVESKIQEQAPVNVAPVVNEKFVAKSPSAPTIPKVEVQQHVLAPMPRPTMGTMPQNYPMPRAPIYPFPPSGGNFQAKMPNYGMNHGNMGSSGTPVQYHYVPLPVIQSNRNYQRLPSFGGAFPNKGYYWVPELSTKTNNK